MGVAINRSAKNRLLRRAPLLCRVDRIILARAFNLSRYTMDKASTSPYVPLTFGTVHILHEEEKYNSPVIRHISGVRINAMYKDSEMRICDEYIAHGHCAALPVFPMLFSVGDTRGTRGTRGAAVHLLQHDERYRDNCRRL